MGLLIGRGLPRKFDILLNALAVDIVDALLAGRSHVGQPGFNQKPRAGSRRWSGARRDLESLGATSPVYLYRMALTANTFTGQSELQH